MTNASRKSWQTAAWVIVSALPLSAQAAIDIQFNYDYDGGFFSDANIGRRNVLDLVASDIEARLVNESFAALTPSGPNSWNLFFDNPGNSGTNVVLNNLTLPANTLTIYVGATPSANNTLGTANFATSYSGTSAWINTIGARDTATNYEPVGGGITFNASTNWHFGTDVSTLQFNQYDFYTVATHEVFHLLGVGQSDAYSADVSGDQQFFLGNAVQNLMGGPVALSAGDISHFTQNTTYLGQTPVMVPALFNGMRRYATELDYALLKDIGYNVSAVPEPSTWALCIAGLLAVAAMKRRSS